MRVSDKFHYFWFDFTKIDFVLYFYFLSNELMNIKQEWLNIFNKYCGQIFIKVIINYQRLEMVSKRLTRVVDWVEVNPVDDLIDSKMLGSNTEVKRSRENSALHRM